MANPLDLAGSAGAGRPAWRSRGYHPGRKVLTVLRGLRHGVLNDFSVSYKLALSLAVLAASLWLRQWVDVALIVLVTANALTAELFNTAIEEICDFIQPGHEPRIGAIKDVAAAAAGVAILVWLAVVSFEFYNAARLVLGPGS
jgi:diacylglycerol kinase (ATP)